MPNRRYTAEVAVRRLQELRAEDSASEEGSDTSVEEETDSSEAADDTDTDISTDNDDCKTFLDIRVDRRDIFYRDRITSLTFFWNSLMFTTWMRS